MQRLREVLLLHALVLSTYGACAGISAVFMALTVCQTIASWDFLDVMDGSDLIVSSEHTQTVTAKAVSNFSSRGFKFFPYASNFSLQSEFFWN